MIKCRFLTSTVTMFCCRFKPLLVEIPCHGSSAGRVLTLRVAFCGFESHLGKLPGCSSIVDFPLP